MSTAIVDTSDIRAQFCAALSELYRSEVPLYADLLSIVESGNARFLAHEGRDAEPRVEVERHGAIRLGTATELAMMGRAFAAMGMAPVGYYDLAPAGVPVHSTAFRPTDAEALARNPFRVFCSLLRLDLISDAALRDEAAAILSRRQIFHPQAIALIEKSEMQGGLGKDDVVTFVAALLETFRWHEEATVDADTYERLADCHRLLADIVAFKGPHINHLTPRSYDIDAAQSAMLEQGIEAKELIEGPPARAVPILLRQTSFKALTETVRFTDQATGNAGRHTARFGEIEQRGAALTPRGRALYDRLLAQVRDEASTGETYQQRLERVFAAFPDDLDALVAQDLIYVRQTTGSQGKILEPITYEDFLPVSAAGIFQSNLTGEVQHNYTAQSSQAEFELALGQKVADPFALYASIAEQSRNAAV